MGTGAPVYCYSPVLLTCCDVYGNQGGDWVGCIADQYGIDGNFSADPLFCAPEDGDFRLQSDSPCAPGSECDLIGAGRVGCGTSSLPDTPDNPPPGEATSWGSIKAMFRK